MVKEILSIPEQHLKDFIYILEVGIYEEGDRVDQDMIRGIEQWIKDEKEYIERLDL